MRPFKELKQIAAGKLPETGPLEPLEANAVDGIRGLLKQYEHERISSGAARARLNEIEKNYKKASQACDIHQLTCRRIVALAGYSKRAVKENNELAMEILSILDGRKGV